MEPITLQIYTTLEKMIEDIENLNNDNRQQSKKHNKKPIQISSSCLNSTNLMQVVMIIKETEVKVTMTGEWLLFRHR